MHLILKGNTTTLCDGTLSCGWASTSFILEWATNQTFNAQTYIGNNFKENVDIFMNSGTREFFFKSVRMKDTIREFIISHL